MTTPHIDAAPGDFAETVLLPGDPLRARFIAEHYLDDCRQVCGLRNMLGYSGRWRGHAVSVMGGGIGIPSLSIYVSELVREFGVRRLIRVGTCGAVQDDLELGQLIAASGAGTDSNVNRLRFGGYDMPLAADFPLLARAVGAAEALKLGLRVGTVFSSDLFYHPDAALPALLKQHGVLAVEMESAGLYGLAAALQAQALTLLAVSDHLGSGASMPPADRERSLDALARLALETAVG
jgi:purine-nucleoside phosphorylase